MSAVAQHQGMPIEPSKPEPSAESKVLMPSLELAWSSQEISVAQPLIAPERAALAEAESLQQDEEPLRFSDVALEQMPDAILLTDLTGKIQKWLGKAEQIFGYTASEAMGQPISFLQQPSVQNTITAEILQQIQHQETDCREVACLHKDGSAVSIELTAKAVCDATGEPLFLLSLNSDISERQRTESPQAQLLQAQTARVEAEAAQQQATFLAEASQVLASSLDYQTTLRSIAELAVPALADWCVVDVVEEDGQICRLGASHVDPAKQVILQELRQRYPLDPDSDHPVLEVLRTGKPIFYPEIPASAWSIPVYDAYYVQLVQALGTKSSMTVPLLARGRTLGMLTFVLGQSGRLYRAEDLALVQDLAHRAALAVDNARLYREAQQARQAAEQAAARTVRLQTVTAALSESLTPEQVAAVIVDQGMAALGATSALVALLNESGTELEIVRAVGYEDNLIQSWRSFSIDAPLPLAEAVRTGKPAWTESTTARVERYPHLREAYSRYNYGAWVSVPLMVEGRSVGGLSLSFTEVQVFSEDDRTLVLALAQQCAQAIERARLYEAERRTRADAQAANRLKDEFLSILSHEIRTPLNGILGWAQLLRRGTLDAATTTRALETIERNARIQTQLIDDLLDVSRIIRGQLSLELRPVSLGPVLEAAIETVRPAAKVKAIDIAPVLKGRESLVSGDANRLQQVVWNLLSNAVKFTPAGGRIEIGLASDPTSARIWVRDTGMGIRANFLPYVFERFRQADSAATRLYGGLGLGLAIVRHLVELHGGSVEVESPGEGQGATFTVRLPRLSIPEEPAASEPKSPEIAESVWLTDLRILVVDDEADARDLLSTVLEQYGAQVTAVASSVEALAAFQHSKPDILLSDIGMPVEDGYALIRKIRTLEAGQDRLTPAAALTAYAKAEDRTRALLAGFQTHIPKPINPQELAIVIAHLAGRTSLT
ncbi:GAF domain-containing protein [Leptolyngbya sp. FACHB-261]|uniref:hybrid sensor histidine kinase/response regulator n=1 Tax=Leptolyngbya sp. FACHB-261 TaxID=2692806 RepID=UPI001686989B|nr:GAF domain-containing protein [Leptolyngbya sp. FACHB-261]MBD2100294.1 GAF domain-containing protein [Leptolyngbya sp. FACHB-261]